MSAELVKNTIFATKPDGNDFTINYHQLPNQPGERYFHIGTCAFNDRNKKLTIKMVTGIPGFWADIDCAKEDNPKPYAATKGEALDILAKWSLYPSVIVETGGGLHCYWLFNEFYPIDDTNRDHISKLATAFQHELRSHFEKNGRTIDTLGDISRLLRVFGPDVVSPKYNPPRPVKLLHETRKCYTVSDLTFQSRNTTSNTQSSTSFTLDADADISLAKLEILLENNEKFRDTWKRKRRDLKDESGSGYAAALASQLYRARWTDQEIVNAIRYWLTKNEFNSRENRPDWYDRLLQFAKSGEPPKDFDDEPLDLDNGDIYELVSERIKMSVECLEKHGNEELVFYIMKFTDGEQVKFNNLAQLVTYRSFKLKVFQDTNIMLPVNVKQVTWEKLVGKMGEVITMVAKDESSIENEMLDWIYDYVSNNPIQNRNSAIAEGKHYVDKDTGIVYIYVPALMTALKLSQIRITSPEIRRRLGLLGFQPQELRALGGRTPYRPKRRFWAGKLPEDSHSENETGLDNGSEL